VSRPIYQSFVLSIITVSPPIIVELGYKKDKKHLKMEEKGGRGRTNNNPVSVIVPQEANITIGTVVLASGIAWEGQVSLASALISNQGK
jgi:hypothetical protein